MLRTKNPLVNEAKNRNGIADGMRHRSSICPRPAVGSRSDAERKNSGAYRTVPARFEREQPLVTAASGITAHNQATAGVKVEYSRQLKGNFYWGADFSARWHLGSLMDYDWSGRGPDPYRNTVAQDIYKLDAMAYYRLPVVKGRLFLRFGAGIGAGYHRMIRDVDGEKDMDKDKVLPYFNVECAWILRVTKGFELKFSPTILLAPSEFSVSPVKLGAPTDVTPWLTDAGFSLTCGWRF